MATVVAVRQGVAFSPQYVRMLASMVREHGSVSLITLTDQDDTPGDCLLLRSRLRGWWSKLELFAPWNEEIRPCVFFDLDTYILGDISDILRDEGESLALLSDFNRPDRGASGMMIIPKETDIWERFNGDTSLKGGDQEFIRRFAHRRLQDEYDGIVSYKRHVLNGITGRICCFHGKPKPHECNGWAGEIWSRFNA